MINGSTISFWKDPWVPNINNLLQHALLLISEDLVDLKVKDYVRAQEHGTGIYYIIFFLGVFVSFWLVFLYPSMMLVRIQLLGLPVMMATSLFYLLICNSPGFLILRRTLYFV